MMVSETVSGNTTNKVSDVVAAGPVNYRIMKQYC